MTDRMLMNPISGEVQSEAQWREEFASMDPELWGGEKFEDAELIEVTQSPEGDWIEA